MSLASVDSPPEPPAMEVEFVDEVGLTSAAPAVIAVPPPPSQAPEIGEAEPVEAQPPGAARANADTASPAYAAEAGGAVQTGAARVAHRR